MIVPGSPLNMENRENGLKKIPVGENTGNLAICVILFAQVVNSLIIKIHDISN